MRSEIETVVSYEKRLAPGALRIDNVPARVISREGEEYLTLFSRDVTSRLYALCTVARQRLANGETSIQLDFRDTTLVLPSPRASQRIRARIREAARAS